MARQTKLEWTAAIMLKSEGYELTPEFRFHPTRKWRADFLVRRGGRECLVECEGLTRFGALGGHQTVSGYEKDLEKYNAAALQGYTVFRFSQRQVNNGDMLEVLAQYFEGFT